MYVESEWVQSCKKRENKYLKQACIQCLTEPPRALSLAAPSDLGFIECSRELVMLPIQPQPFPEAHYDSLSHCNTTLLCHLLLGEEFTNAFSSNWDGWHSCMSTLQVQRNNCAPISPLPPCGNERIPRSSTALFGLAPLSTGQDSVTSTFIG